MGNVNRVGRWQRLMWAASLSSALVGLSVTSGCVVAFRARAGVVADTEPPPEQAEAVPAARPGYVWVRGHWEWRGGQWQWQQGHWQRERAQYVWVDGHWERRGNKYHWVEGYWQAAGSAPAQGGGGVVVHDHRGQGQPQQTPPGSIDVPARPGKPEPPAPPAEQVPPARQGYVWIKGYYVWNGSQYVWKKGYWERARGQQQWVDGHWERQGNDYVWIEGRWQ